MDNSSFKVSDQTIKLEEIDSDLFRFNLIQFKFTDDKAGGNGKEGEQCGSTGSALFKLISAEF